MGTCELPLKAAKPAPRPFVLSTFLFTFVERNLLLLCFCIFSTCIFCGFELWCCSYFIYLTIRFIYCTYVLCACFQLYLLMLLLVAFDHFTFWHFILNIFLNASLTLFLLLRIFAHFLRLIEIIISDESKIEGLLTVFFSFSF